MGHSRGGLTTKIHALVDAEGRPIHLKLTPGPAHDGRSAADMFDTVQAKQILLADRAYDSDRLRTALKDRGAWGCIRPMPTRKRFPAFGPWLYKQRNATQWKDTSVNSRTSALLRPDTTNEMTTSG